MKIVIILLLSFSFTYLSYGQTAYTQTVRGSVIDADTEIPLSMTLVITENLSTKFSAQTDALGEFYIENVPIGKHTIKTILGGFKPIILSNINVVSGKETVLNIVMEMDVIPI